MIQENTKPHIHRRGFMQAAGGLALGLHAGIGGLAMARAGDATSSAGELDPKRFKTRFAPVAEGVDLAYVREGAGGVPLLLVHGWPWSKRLWWRNIEPLAAAGFDVIVPDQRGTGESTVPADPLAYVSMAQSAIDLRHLLAHLGHERAVLVGGDFGCGVVQDMSNRFPGLAIRQCGFNGPSPAIPQLFQAAGITGDQISEVMAVSDHVVENGLHADALLKRYDTDDKRRKFIASHYLNRAGEGGASGKLAAPGAFTAESAAFMAEAYADAAHFRASLGWYEAFMKPERGARPPLLGQVGQTETLILYGAEDRVVGPKFMDRMRLAYPRHVGPFIVPGAGHFLPWEQADVLNTALIDFCRDLL